MGRQPSSFAEVYLEQSWQEALTRVLEELEGDICAKIFSSREREDLHRMTRDLRDKLPSRHALPQWVQIYQEACDAVPKALVIPGCDAVDAIEIHARLIALKADLLRITAELAAFQLKLLTDESRRRQGKRHGGTSRDHLIRAFEQILKPLASTT